MERARKRSREEPPPFAGVRPMPDTPSSERTERTTRAGLRLVIRPFKWGDKGVFKDLSAPVDKEDLRLRFLPGI